MDPITQAIVGAVAAMLKSEVGKAMLTEVGKTAITDAYNHLKALLSKKFGGESDVVHAVNEVEATPDSAGRKATLQEEVAAAKADQDQEVLQASQALLHLLRETPEGGQHVQTATGSYIAQADRASSASVTIGRTLEP